MAALQIQCTGARDARMMLELYERGADGASPTLVRCGVLAAGISVTVDTTPTQFLHVYELGSDERKSADNW